MDEQVEASAHRARVGRHAGTLAFVTEGNLAHAFAPRRCPM